jgi:hypothetical protein
VSFAAITLSVASQQVFVVYFVIDSVRKLLDTSSYMSPVDASANRKRTDLASSVSAHTRRCIILQIHY